MHIHLLITTFEDKLDSLDFEASLYQPGATVPCYRIQILIQSNLMEVLCILACNISVRIRQVNHLGV